VAVVQAAWHLLQVVQHLVVQEVEELHPVASTIHRDVVLLWVSNGFASTSLACQPAKLQQSHLRLETFEGWNRRGNGPLGLAGI